MEFAEILNGLMQQRDYTQKEIARLIGVKQSQISEWLNGKAKPGYDTLRAMAKGLNVTGGFLLGLEDEDGRRME